MIVLGTCKNEEDPIKNKGARGITALFFDFFSRSRATNSVIADGILMKFILIQAFMVVLETCMNEENPSQNEGTGVVTIFSHYKSIGIFPDAQG